jgi:acetyltransferase
MASFAGRSPLAGFFNPSNIAVIGATDREGSVGRAVLDNLEGFKGEVFAVNPKRESLLGRTAFHTVLDVPAAIDLAVIVTPAKVVPEVVRQCAEKRVGAALILSAGFKEVGAAGAALEQEIAAAAGRAKMPIIGPNCLGLMSPHLGLNATFAGAMARPGNLAFISQSGALCTAILDWSLGENVGFSGFISIGSMLDVGWSELISHFGEDPHTHAIACYIESIGDARKFLSAAREVARSKPIIVLKAGVTPAGSRAAVSHTGALTGSDEALDAAFRRAGVLRVDTVAELFDMAEALAKQSPPKGPRLAIVTNAGGPGVLSTDMLVRSGGTIAELSAETRSRLDALLPAHWSHGNPVDILGDADPTRYAEAVEIVARDPGSDGVLVILTPQKMSQPTATAERLVPLAAAGKPLLASWMGGTSVKDAEQVLNRAKIPTFSYPDAAAQAFQHMWRYRQMLRATYETPTIDGSIDPTQEELASQIVQRATRHGRTLLTGFESAQVLAAYGIPMVPVELAQTEAEAVQAAEKLGLPVVAKLNSDVVTHKTDVGGVKLNLVDRASVREAFQAIEKSCLEKLGKGAFQGCTLQPMIRAQGYELILGSSVDAQLGPVLLFGAGGELVEVLGDHALGLPPLNGTLARLMIERTKISKALRGVRGRKPVDLTELQALLIRFSELVITQPRVAEVEVNPLLANEEGLVALDARVVLHPMTVTDDQLPRSAIRPYPKQYLFELRLDSGTPIVLRPIRAEDEPLLAKFHQNLSDESVYLRYFESQKLEQRIAHERLSRSCCIDYDHEMVLVAEHRASDGPEILGVGKLTKLAEPTAAEFALLVGDQWQGQGLGKRLLEALLQVARGERLKRIVGCTLASNARMRHIARKVGFSQSPDPAGREYDLQIDL